MPSPAILLPLDGTASSVVLLLAQRCDFLLELVERVEGLVHAGEPEISHLVELPQRGEDRQPHLVTRDLGRALGPDGLLDALRELRDRVLVDGPALAGLADATHDLRPAEGLGDAAALDHGENRLLHRGEPLAALGARATTPDQRPVLGLTRVDHARVGVATVRAAHFDLPPERAPAAHPDTTKRDVAMVNSIAPPCAACG